MTAARSYVLKAPIHRVNLIMDDGEEISHGFSTEESARTFKERCQKRRDVVEVKYIGHEK